MRFCFYFWAIPQLSNTYSLPKLRSGYPLLSSCLCNMPFLKKDIRYYPYRKMAQKMKHEEKKYKIYIYIC